jgi:hypothetical protein
MKEHDCYLANWIWLKGRDNQDKLVTWHKVFQRSPPPSLNFVAKSSLDDRTLMCECDSMLHDNWLDIPCIVILYSFCFKPRMVSDKKYPKEYFHNYIPMLISQGHHSRRWKLILYPKSACFRTEARPWETFELCF